MLNAGCIVALPSGFIAKVVTLIGDSAILQFPGNPINFTQKISELRYLGESYQPLVVEPDFLTLFAQRSINAQRILSCAKTPKTRKPKVPKERSLMELLAQASPEECIRILQERGLLNLETKGGEKE